MTELRERVAVVTGAGGGIGRAIAAELAARGATVWVADVNVDAASRVAGELGGTATAAAVDVASRASVDGLAKEVFERHERVDVVVANAGVSSMNRFLDLSEDEWDRNFEVNARGAFLTLQAFGRRMVEQPMREGDELRGKLVATASMAARAAAPLLAHYSASKFAVIGLVQAAAKELAAHKVTVNAVDPGFVRTSMQDREVEWEAELRGMTPDEVRAEYVAATPLGRLQEPADVARVVAFLAGPDADFLTGEVIEANGGALTT